MSDLPLNSLEITNFRAFDHLRIGRLGRLNLIVGRNNVGKTSLLEAIRLYSQPGNVRVILEILGARDENRGFTVGPPANAPGRRSPIDCLFHRPAAAANGAPARTLTVGRVGDDRGRVSVSSDGSGVMVDGRTAVSMLQFARDNETLTRPAALMAADLGQDDWDGPDLRRLKAGAPPSQYLTTAGLAGEQVERLWDAVALTDDETRITRALGVVTDRVDRIVLRNLGQAGDARVPFVRLKDDTEPAPLRSLGEGVNRVFQFALGMFSCRGGILLIDEIENGLHYSVLTDLWRFLFTSAAEFGVQGFATTHSADCIRSFEEAAAESEEEGVLIQLARKDGKTQVIELDERELGIAVEGAIEVRG